MTRTVGIIPAGGKAERFNGIQKELLPISQTSNALSRCISVMRLGGADEIIVATNREKLSSHWNIIGNLPYVRPITRYFEGLWDVIAEAAKADAHWYYFAMPDTVFPMDAFRVEKTCDVMAGVFETKQPERFGVFRDNLIIDKRPAEGTQTAWGVWIWSHYAMEYLAEACRREKDHTRALNLLIHQFGFETFPLEYYYDFASFDDYLRFLCSLT